MIEFSCPRNSDFNPRPPRGGRPRKVFPSVVQGFISIHAPREGGDFNLCRAWSFNGYFNPRPPRGGRLCRFGFGFYIRNTISIHAPREGGDREQRRPNPFCHYFNPRPPRGGRPRITNGSGWYVLFQSTPPARGATLFSYYIFFSFIYFNPRPPRGGRLCPYRFVHGAGLGHFNPRPPRGGRLISALSSLGARSFQSTPPARGATAKMHSFTCGSLTNK